MAAVAIPECVEDVSHVVQWAADNDICVTTREGAHSQGGQWLSDGGVVIDTRRLDRIEILGPDLVRVQGGAIWGTVIDALEGSGHLPFVLADTPGVTVGGTLSAAGFGSDSHLFGTQVGHVEQLEVVTGTGECLRCSRTLNSDLFDAVRCSQGQFGVITEAWIRLRTTRKKVGIFALRYNDYDRFANDRALIAESRPFDHMQIRLDFQ